jgi:transcriptional regulator with XRE-family HTH domain
MERQFRLNWSALVEEARARRKAQNLTQQRLARLAEVSTPTISRFENGEKDIQLSSALSILGVLGLLDARVLNFPDPEPRYDSINETVRFWGHDGTKRVLCAITNEALDDHYKPERKDKLKTFEANRAAIEQEARRKFLADTSEPDGSVIIRTADLY